MISVFAKDDQGRVRHFYSAHPHLSETIRERGIDLLSPVWHILDLTPRAAAAGTQNCPVRTTPARRGTAEPRRSTTRTNGRPHPSRHH